MKSNSYFLYAIFSFLICSTTTFGQSGNSYRVFVHKGKPLFREAGEWIPLKNRALYEDTCWIKISEGQCCTFTDLQNVVCYTFTNSVSRRRDFIVQLKELAFTSCEKNNLIKFENEINEREKRTSPAYIFPNKQKIKKRITSFLPANNDVILPNEFDFLVKYNKEMGYKALYFTLQGSNPKTDSQLIIVPNVNLLDTNCLPNIDSLKFKIINLKKLQWAISADSNNVNFNSFVFASPQDTIILHNKLLSIERVINYFDEDKMIVLRANEYLKLNMFSSAYYILKSGSIQFPNSEFISNSIIELESMIEKQHSNTVSDNEDNGDFCCVMAMTNANISEIAFADSVSRNQIKTSPIPEISKFTGNGIFIEVNNAGELLYEQLEPTTTNNINGGGYSEHFGNGMTGGISDRSIKVGIANSEAYVTTKDIRPVFYFIFGGNRMDMKKVLEIPQDSILSPNDFVLLKAVISKKGRQITINHDFAYGSKTRFSKSEIPFRYIKISNDVYRVYFENDLPAGEYVFYYKNSSLKFSSLKLFDFSVKNNVSEFK